ncbi:MAG: 6-phospho-beta-glucosidase [Bellilinea sp.]
MDRTVKVCVIGAGSSYTPELIEGCIENHSELPVKRLSLMDIDERKLGIVGNLAQRMVQASGPDMEVELTTDRRKAVEGADFVITQIRVGGMAARILDEKIPPQFGVIGQETTGPGGFAKALRTIPVLMGIARDIQELAPNAFLINFTNPAGLVTEALQRYSPVKSIGLCNIPIGAEMRISEQLKVDRKRIQLDWIGLNHLNWMRGVTVDGQDFWPQVLTGAIEEARKEGHDGEGISAEMLEILGMIPCSYLDYFYNHPNILEKQKKASRTRGEEVAEIEAQLLEMYRDPALKEKPKLLEKRGGAYYSKAAVSLISAIYNDKQEIHIVNTRNQGAIPDLSDDVVVEIATRVGASGVQPIKTTAVPAAVRGLVEAVKAYEVLTAQAALNGDRKLALQALWTHPLVPSYESARGVLDALLQAHRRYLPQFFPGD